MDASKASIQGLREQIFSNAALLFPKAIEEHYEVQGGDAVKPADVFDIVTIGMYGDVRAVLVYGLPFDRKEAAEGPAACHQEEAMRSLLWTLTNGLVTWYSEHRLAGYGGTNGVLNNTLM